MTQKVVVVNTRLPEEIIKWIDRLVVENIYNSRSEAVREFAREYVIKHRE